jgi:hypothetical protein
MEEREGPGPCPERPEIPPSRGCINFVSRVPQKTSTTEIAENAERWFKSKYIKQAKTKLPLKTEGMNSKEVFAFRVRRCSFVFFRRFLRMKKIKRRSLLQNS